MRTPLTLCLLSLATFLCALTSSRAATIAVYYDTSTGQIVSPVTIGPSTLDLTADYTWTGTHDYSQIRLVALDGFSGTTAISSPTFGLVEIEGDAILTDYTGYTKAAANAAFLFPAQIDTFAELDALVADQTLLNASTGYTQAAANAAFATAAQGALADTALQPGDSITNLDFGTGTDGYVWTSDGAGAEAWEPVSGSGIGDMSAATYDPNNVAADAFAMDNMAEGTTTKIFTATERTKLAGIQALAQVNNISDPNATDLTDAGDTTLHFHSADRARANHTGTQTAATISDFDTEVSNNSAVTANTAKLSATTANVTTALDAATLTDAGTPAATDQVLLKDASTGALQTADFSEFGGSGDLLSTNNLSDVANAATAFGNIKQAATTTATGVVELATTAETLAGTATDKVIVPADLFALLSTPAWRVDYDYGSTYGATGSASAGRIANNYYQILTGTTATSAIRYSATSTAPVIKQNAENSNGFWSWDLPGSMSFVFELVAATTNGEVFICLADKTATSTSIGIASGDESVGIRIANTTLYGLVANDDPSLDESIATSTTLTLGAYYAIQITWDGSGNVTWYVNGSQVATSATGPTGLSVNYRPTLEVDNGGDAANQRVHIGPWEIR